ncbi:MAG: PqqD family protein [Actinomycetota bacterium]
MLISPDEIDDRTVPVPTAHAALVEIDDAGVLVDEAAGRGYALNATASLLWKLFDSNSSLGEVIDDITAVFDVPRQEIADSVHGLVRFFGEMGLFDNVTRNVASLPVDIEYVDIDECGEPIPPGPQPTFDARYLEAPPNA